MWLYLLVLADLSLLYGVVFYKIYSVAYMDVNFFYCVLTALEYLLFLDLGLLADQRLQQIERFSQ